jgi:phosphate-selective porin
MLAVVLEGAESAQVGGVESRLQRLEDQLKGLEQENRELRRQLGLDPATNGWAWVKPGGRSYEIRVGGLIQAHAEFGDPGDARWTGQAANDRFYVRRARIQVYGKFLEQFSYRLQGDFAGSMGEVSGQRASLTDGWVGWNRYDFANLKLGQYYPSYGWEKRLNPLALDVVELTLPGIKLLPERQLGAQVAGGWFSNRVGYAFGAFNGNNLNNSFNDSDKFMVVPRIQGTPVRGQVGRQTVEWNLGLSGYYSDDARVSLAPEFNLPGTNYFAGVRMGLDLDTQLRIGPFDCWVEYLQTDFDPSVGSDYVARGWYVQAGYFFLPKWQGVVQYQVYDPSDAQAGDTTRSWTLGLNYCLRGDDLMVSLNYLLMDVPGEEHLQEKVLMRLQAGF